MKQVQQEVADHKAHTLAEHLINRKVVQAVATDLRALWSRPDTRKALLAGLAEKGYGDDQLIEISRLIDAEKSDLYDVLTYIAYATEPISRRERVMTHKALIFSLP